MRVNHGCRSWQPAASSRKTAPTRHTNSAPVQAKELNTRVLSLLEDTVTPEGEPTTSSRRQQSKTPTLPAIPEFRFGCPDLRQNQQHVTETYITRRYRSNEGGRETLSDCGDDWMCCKDKSLLLEHRNKRGAKRQTSPTEEPYPVRQHHCEQARSNSKHRRDIQRGEAGDPSDKPILGRHHSSL